MTTPTRKNFKVNDLVEELMRDRRRGKIESVCEASLDVRLYDPVLKRPVLVQFRTCTAQEELEIVG